MENIERVTLQKIYEMEKGEGVMFTDFIKRIKCAQIRGSADP